MRGWASKLKALFQSSTLQKEPSFFPPDAGRSKEFSTSANRGCTRDSAQTVIGWFVLIARSTVDLETKHDNWQLAVAETPAVMTCSMMYGDQNKEAICDDNYALGQYLRRPSLSTQNALAVAARGKHESRMMRIFQGLPHCQWTQRALLMRVLCQNMIKRYRKVKQDPARSKVHVRGWELPLAASPRDGCVSAVRLGAT